VCVCLMVPDVMMMIHDMVFRSAFDFRRPRPSFESGLPDWSAGGAVLLPAFALSLALVSTVSVG